MHEKYDQNWWEAYFAPGGGWETNGGRRQTRIFAQAFADRSGLAPGSSFSLLDVGCALGDGLEVLHRRFPLADLFGIDFSPMAIKRCQTELKGIASFSVQDMLQLTHWYDIIFISNVLEHFIDFHQRARKLVMHCQRLYIMVPYNEQRDGVDMEPDHRHHHQHTFQPNSFDFLIKEGLATEIHQQVFSCPGAWGWDTRRKVQAKLRNSIRFITGRERLQEPRQVLYDIVTVPANKQSDYLSA